MLDTLMQTLTTTEESAVTNLELMAAILAALAMGFAISICFLINNKSAMTRRSFAVTLVMLPVILAVIILFVGSNIARAFSLAGVLSIIRFRSAPGDPKDIGYIFFATGAGVAAGVGMYIGGGIFVAILSIVLTLMEAFHFGGIKTVKTLKITLPENMDYGSAFENVLKHYTKKYLLKKVRTTDLGSLFEVSYQVVLDDKVNEKEFLDELRCCNGNLSITLDMRPEE